MIVDGFPPMGHGALSAHFAVDGGFLSYELSATTFVAGHSEVVARCQICSLPELSNPVDDLLPLFLVNRYLESRLARGRPNKGDRQVASGIRLRLCLLRCFEDFEELPGLGGGLEA
jgi:hypothetical protein